MKNPYIIFDADPFCFGPISTTLNLANYLRTNSSISERYDLILLGTLTTKQLAEKTQVFNDIIECDTTDTKELSQRASLILGSSLYIANTNPTAIRLFENQAFNKVYIDTLFWMWDKLQANFRTVEAYFIQNFFNTESQLKRFQDQINRPIIVSPIIDPNLLQTTKIEEDYVLITLGGIDTVYAESTNFYEVFLGRLLSSELLKKQKIVVAGGGETIGRLKRKFELKHSNISIDVFGRAKFLDLLLGCKKLIANPGLNTFYESSIIGKDTYFLPPQNYSQQLQLLLYMKYQPDIKGYAWQPVFGYPDIPESLPELEGIRLVQKCCDRFLSMEDEQQRLQNDINNFLCEGPSKLKLHDKINFFESGVVQITKNIQSLLKEAEERNKICKLN